VSGHGRPARLLVWDFDGTLADTYAAIQRSTDAALTAHGRPPCDPALLRTTVGLTLAEALALVVGDDDPTLIGSLVAVYRETFTTDGPALCSLYPGIADLLAELAGRGAACAVATSRRRVSTEDLLARFGVADRFVTVHCESDLGPGRGKPCPDLVLSACTAAGVDPGDAVVIGDAPVDIGMGRAAGATTIAVAWGHGDPGALLAAGPDHVVGDLAELRAILAATGDLGGSTVA
jgi:phosphoglycolate phosphatase-like HAD superfamily hydrolase